MNRLLPHRLPLVLLPLLSLSLLSACGSSGSAAPETATPPTVTALPSSQAPAGESTTAAATDTSSTPTTPAPTTPAPTTPAPTTPTTTPTPETTPAETVQDPPATEAPISGCTLDALETELLNLINEARRTARSCGTTSYKAVAEVAWSCTLEQAALSHSTDMATNNFFSHTGSNGLSAGDRIKATGYSYRTYGENIAAGQTSASQVMQGWLNSAGHCKNIMNANFTEVAVSKVDNSAADYRIYWTQVFAAPR